MKKTKYVVTAVICFVLAIIYGFLAIVMISSDADLKYDLQNEVSSTVKEIVAAAEEDNIVRIYTNDYLGFLVVQKNRIKKENLDKLLELKNGDKIYFRAADFHIKQEFYIVDTIRTDTCEFISPKDYAESSHKDTVSSHTTFVVVPLIFLATAVISIVKMKKLNNKKVGMNDNSLVNLNEKRYSVISKISLKIGLLILFALISVGMLGNIVIVKKDILPDSKALTEVTATVRQTRQNNQVQIYTEEYYYSFSIDNGVLSEKNLNSIMSLSKGDKIYCTLNSESKVQPLTDCRIFSLRTDNAELLSINEYLNYTEQKFIGLAAAGISVSVVCLMIVVILLISIIMNCKQLKKRNTPIVVLSDNG